MSDNFKIILNIFSQIFAFKRHYNSSLRSVCQSEKSEITVSDERKSNLLQDNIAL